jgi:hypothetical protein
MASPYYLITMAERKQSAVLRIVDTDGHRIFRNFDLRQMSGENFRRILLPGARKILRHGIQLG